MLASFVLIVSIALQFVAAFFALRLIRVTGRSLAWGLIATAVVLMAVRRSITFFSYLADSVGKPLDLSAELVALVISACIAAGLARIAPLFQERRRAEEALRRATELLETIFSTTRMLVAYLDRDFNFVRVNRAYAQADNRSPEFFIGKNHFTLYPDEENLAIFRRVVESGEPFSVAARPFRYPEHPERGVTYWDWSLQPVRGADGTTAALILSLLDVTEHKRAARDLALVSFALDNVREAAFLIDESARFRYVNEESCRTLGYSREELLGLGVADVDPDFPSVRWPEHWEELKTRGSLIFEGRHRRKDGSAFPVEINANYFEYDGGSYNLALVRDIAERRQAEEERSAHLRFLRSMDRVSRAIQGTGDLDRMMGDVLDAVLAVFDCDRAWLLHPCDPEAPSLRVPMERTKPQYPGAKVSGGDIPNEPAMAEVFRLVLQKPGPMCCGPGSEYPLPPQGAERFGIRSAMHMAIHPKFGKPWLFGLHQCSRPRVWTAEEKHLFHEIGIRLTDGLTSLLAHRDLRESENKLAEAQRLAHIGYWDRDLDAGLVTLSDEACRIFGIPGQEEPLDLVAWQELWSQLIHPEDRERVLLAAGEALRGGSPYDEEYRVLRPDGSLRIVHSCGRVMSDAAGRPHRMFGSMQDISERRQALEQIREHEAFIRNILETVDEGFIVVDRQYRIISANRAFCAMVGIGEAELQGRPCHEVVHGAARPCFEKGEDCPIERAFASGMPQSAFHCHEDAEGGKRYVELKAFPVTDSTGAVVSVIETVNDVTEKRKLEEQLLQSQKMEAVGRLAGGVAHDFNNMVGVIIGHTELALRQLEPGHRLFANLQEVRKAAGRSADLTRQLLAFARKQTVVPRVLDLNSTVEGMLKILRRLIGEDIDLAWLPGKEVWPVRMDPSQLDQILANLCVNARDAVTGVGKVTIETRNAAIDEAYCAGHPDAVPGEYVLLAVSDNGCGMARETIDRIFEPFFTTKELGKGTGLGLATVYGIVRQNNGFVNVYSEPAQGSTFKIYLPRHAAPIGEQPEEAAVLPVPGGHETILLAEDEPAILEMVREVLSGCGYRVLAAASPREAIRIAREHQGQIDLLITDVIMPEMNGQELAETLRGLFPRSRKLFMSGYTDDVIVHHGVLAEGVHFLQKPFTIQALAVKVREVLDANPDGH